MSAATSLPSSPASSLAMLLRALKLPTFLRCAEEVAQKAEREGWSFGQYLLHLCELEIEERRRRRIARNLRDSGLPSEKTLATLDRTRLPAKVQKVLPSLCEGGFVERGENVLAFGLPGRGKTHLVCGIGHELVNRGNRVLFTATFALVQRLLAAKRDLRLERELAALDGFDAVILDSCGVPAYVESPLANRCEPGSSLSTTPHKRSRSEGLEPSEDRGVAPPRRDGRVDLLDRSRLRDRRALGLEVDGGVPVRRLDARMTEPVADGDHVDPGLQEVDRGRVSDDVGVDPLRRERDRGRSGEPGVLPQDVPDTEPGQWVTSMVPKELSGGSRIDAGIS